MICRNCKETHSKTRAGDTVLVNPFCKPMIVGVNAEIYTSLYEKMENLEYLEWCLSKKDKSNV
jgi:hypothetical protein